MPHAVSFSVDQCVLLLFQEVCDILSRISVFQAFDIFSVVDVLEGVRQKLQVNVRIQNTIILCNKLEKNIHYLSVNEALQGQ